MGGAHRPRVRRVMAEPRPGGETKREEGGAGFRRAGPFAETLDQGRRKSQNQTTFPEDCRQDAGRGGSRDRALRLTRGSRPLHVTTISRTAAESRGPGTLSPLGLGLRSLASATPASLPPQPG